MMHIIFLLFCKEDTMFRRTLVGLLLVLFAASFGFAQDETDIKGSADHPLFTRMPGYYISEYEGKEFDKYDSYLTGAEASWEGKMTRISYEITTGAKQPSMLQIARNYENALKKIGGKVLYSEGRVVEGKIEKNGGVTYIHAEAFNEGRNYLLVIVEKQAMKQDVVADAASLSNSIASTGKVVVEGIYFDGDKATIKPESAASIEEIVKLLKQNPKLALYVVGHTANVGTLESCLKLSSDRANAIVEVLVGKGIAAARLKAVGVGPYSPAASNRTEEGKTKNRRVELVER
jgi:outer membrane protein OmpA-like peptidoglycan-associated protein